MTLRLKNLDFKRATFFFTYLLHFLSKVHIFAPVLSATDNIIKSFSSDRGALYLKDKSIAFEKSSRKTSKITKFLFRYPIFVFMNSSKNLQLLENKDKFYKIYECCS